MTTDDAFESNHATIVLLDVVGSNRLAAEIEKHENIAVDASTLGEEGFRWKATQYRGKPALLIAAAKPVGLLYGVYALLEKLGFGFYLGGDTFPAVGTPLTVDSSLDEVHKPAFAVRGALPWGNLPNGYWDLDDLKYIYDQLSKQRFNFVGFHQYDHEPFCAYYWQGNLVEGRAFFSNEEVHCGSTPLQVKDFGFGTAAYFDRDPFTSRTTLDGKDHEDRVRRAQKMLADSFDYAHQRGLRVALGFELPGDPTNADVLARLEAKIAAMLKNYPQLDYVWFFQSEGGTPAGCVPTPGSALAALVRQKGAAFDYLREPKQVGEGARFGEKQVAEGVRFGEFANRAYTIAKRLRPDIKVAINGWGGDHWDHFTDLFVGLDKILPKDVIFAAQDNLHCDSQAGVSRAYGELPADRSSWPIPWWNNDNGREMVNPRAHTRFFLPICRDMLAKRCQGMLGVYWNGRLIEEPAGFQARFAWNPNLSYEEFYDDFATRCFGPKWGPRMSGILRELEALGAHWTGAGGFVGLYPYPWFVPGDLSKPENVLKLADIRVRLGDIRDEMIAQRQLGGLERIEWLTTTIDWLVRFDKAAFVLYSEGPVEKLLAEAEAAVKQGNRATAKEKAQAARQLMLQCGYREALQTYPKKMSVLDDFGDFVRIQTTSYAAYYLVLHRRVEAILGKLPEDLAGPAVPMGSPPLIVGRQPYCVLSAGEDVPVNAIVISGEIVQSCVLHYRKLGADCWTDVPISSNRDFPTAYRGRIPGGELEPEDRGLEWFVSAVGASGRTAYWPKGYPSVVWSATIIPNSSQRVAK